MNINTINFDENPNRVYSDIVVVDDKYLYLSGLVSEDLKTGEVIDGDITVQTRQTLTNLKNILEANGSDMDHVIRVEVIMKDFSERNEMNAEYAKHFSYPHIPSRVCYGNAAIADDLKIEILATAIKK